MVRGRFKLIRVEIFDDTFLPASTDCLSSGLPTSENFNMNHVMLLLTKLCVIVDSTIEDKIPRFHLFKLKINRQSVILVSLIPSVKFEAKVFSQIIDDLPDQCTAVKKQGRIVKRITRAMIALTIRYTEILDAAIDELLSELSFEFWVLSIDLRLSRHIVAVLDLLFFGLAESLEILLQTS